MPNLVQRLIGWAAVKAGYHLTEWSADRQFWVRPTRSAREEIPYGVRHAMLSWSRELERKDPLFSRFLDLCEQYVIGPTGLRIVSGSADAKWAQLANAEWESWQPWCDIATRFSFGQRQSIIEREVEVAGECFVCLTYGSSSRPRIQLIPSENVATPAKYANDKSVFDGVRVDDNDRPLGYFVRKGNGPDDFDERPAEEIVHIFEPSRIGQHRGLPIIYPVLKDLVDLSELQNFEMLAAKDASEKSSVIKTNGELSVANLRRQMVAQSTQNPDGTATTSNRAEYYQQALGGRTVVLKAGDEMTQYQSNRPSVAVQSFWDYVSARAAAGMGLPLEILIMRSLQGTMTRAALDMANAFFRARAAARAESFGRIWEHVIFNTRSLRTGQPGDWRRTRYTPPRAINVDVGRNSAALINEYRAGLRTLEDIAAEMGRDWRDVLRQRRAELLEAAQMEAESGLAPGSLLGTPAQTIAPAPEVPQ